MAQTSYHIIQQKIFDIHVKKRDNYFELQNRFSRLFHNSLFQLLENFLDKEIPPQFNFRIETITVDLGTVSYNNLEKEITDIFIEKFRKALNEITGDIPLQLTETNYNSENATNPADKYIAIVEFFLLSGTLPWWAAGEDLSEPLKIINELLLNQKSGLKQLLERIGKNDKVRKRLIYQLPESYIKSIIQILEPDKADFIFQYHEEIIKQHVQKPVVKAETTEVQKAIWLFIFDYILVDRGSIFEEKSFVRSSIYRMAMFFNLHYEELLDVFYQTLQSVPVAMRKSSALGTIIAEVYKDQLSGQDEKAVTVQLKPGEQPIPELLLLNKLKFIQHYLVYGSFIFESVPYTKDAIVTWVAEMFHKAPLLFVEQLNKLIKNIPATQRLFSLIDKTLFKKWIEILAPENADIVYSYLDFLYALKQSHIAARMNTASDALIYAAVIEELLTFKKSSFNMMLFLKEHLQYISVIYSIDDKDVLKLMMQNAIQQYGNKNNDVVIVEAFASLLKDQDIQIKMKNISGKKLLQDFLTPTLTEDIAAKKEFLEFYLRYGSLPFWTIESMPEPIEKYLDELIKSNAQHAFELIRLFDRDEMSKVQLLSATGIARLSNLFAKLPGATVAFDVYEQLLSLLQTSFIAEFISREDIHRLLLLEFWDQYKISGYKSFNARNFTTKLIKRISVLLHTETLIVAGSLQQKIIKDDQKYSSFFKEEMQKAATLIYKEGRSFNDKEEQTGEITVSEILLQNETVIYFLKNNALPFAQDFTVNTDNAIKKMFLSLLQRDANYLERLLASEQVDADALCILYRLFFTQKDSAERNMLRLIQSAINKNIAAKFGNLFEIGTTGFLKLTAYLLGFKTAATHTSVFDIIDYKNIIALIRSNEALSAAEVAIAKKMLRDVNDVIITDKEIELFLQYVLQLYKSNPGLLQKNVEHEDILLLHHLILLQHHKDLPESLKLPAEEIQRQLLLYSEAFANITFTHREKNKDVKPVETLVKQDLPAASTVHSKEILEQYAAGFLNNTKSTDIPFAIAEHLLVTENWQSVIPRINYNSLIALLKELLIDAHKISALRLKQLLNNKNITVKWFETLFLVFNSAVSVEERSVKELVRTAAERKITEVLQQRELVQKEAQELSTILNFVIQKENGRQFIRLLHDDEYGDLILQSAIPFLDYEQINKLLIAGISPADRHAIFFTKVFGATLQHLQMVYRDKEVLLALYKQFLLKFVIGKITVNDPFSFVKAFFDYGDQQNPQLLIRLYFSFSGMLQNRTSIAALSFMLLDLQKEIQERIKKYYESIIAHKHFTDGKVTAADARILQQLKNELEKKKRSNKSLETKYPALKDSNAEMEKIYITNAGLVLLNPFLSVYFSRLNLLDKGKFINETSQQRAVHLLAYIADGKEEHAEHTLSLNKLLCGLEMNEPVETTFTIRENEKELTEQMLNVVFQRWEKLKNSTIRGFRDNFINREGMLVKTHEGWNLRVEQRGYDVLLDTIPWGFRFIKLLWMKVILTVEWM